jgi:hypothetical protein
MYPKEGGIEMEKKKKRKLLNVRTKESKVQKPKV